VSVMKSTSGMSAGMSFGLEGRLGERESKSTSKSKWQDQLVVILKGLKGAAIVGSKCVRGCDRRLKMTSE
jgi:hypothetical protein